MTHPASLLSPDLASCRIVQLGARTPAWRWDDLADEEPWNRTAQPVLPFETETPVPEILGEDIGEEVRRTAASLARVIAEVLGGLRAAAQLSRWLDDPPLRVLAEAARTYRRTPTAVASVRVQATASGSYEVTLRLRRGRGFAAAALRLERRRGRWRCTALVVGP